MKLYEFGICSTRVIRNINIFAPYEIQNLSHFDRIVVFLVTSVSSHAYYFRCNQTNSFVLKMYTWTKHRSNQFQIKCLD